MSVPVTLPPYPTGPPYPIPSYTHRQYELTVRQEPKQARMCGVGGKADRRPIDPPPIVQLRVIDPYASNSTNNGSQHRQTPSISSSSSATAAAAGSGSGSGPKGRTSSAGRRSGSPTPGAGAEDRERGRRRGNGDEDVDMDEKNRERSSSPDRSGENDEQEDQERDREGSSTPTPFGPGEGQQYGYAHSSTYLQNPYYFMFASLAKPDDDVELHWLKDGRTRCTTGSVVSSLYHLKDPQRNNEDAGFFVFPDLSVRTEGSYRLKLSLFEVVGNTVRHCKSIFSAPFYVYTAKKFPGMEESTPLSCSLADQGIKIRIRKDIRVRKRPMPQVETSSQSASNGAPFTFVGQSQSNNTQNDGQKSSAPVAPAPVQIPPPPPMNTTPTTSHPPQNTYAPFPPVPVPP
ncbi:velum formation-related protein, partial [Marasmius crinis-equi]